MTRPEDPKRSFTAFRSAAEEVDMRAQAESCNIEGGHLSSTCGPVVCNRKGDVPYTVILTREAGETSEHGFSTMHEAEAFIRNNTPLPVARSTLYDHDAENA